MSPRDGPEHIATDMNGIFFSAHFILSLPFVLSRQSKDSQRIVQQPAICRPPLKFGESSWNGASVAAAQCLILLPIPENAI